jgi:hypothetical protein
LNGCVVTTPRRPSGRNDMPSGARRDDFFAAADIGFDIASAG